MTDAAPEPGWVDPALTEELPGLGLSYTTLERGSGRSPRAVKQRLQTLADRFYGAQAINLRQQPIPMAYRVFFRHIGLDPDTHRTPVEEVALMRMHDGGLKSQNLLDDALTISTMEVGVALRAFDADRITGRLGIRPSAPAERLVESEPHPLGGGTLVIADEQGPIGVLFGPTAERRGVHPDTKRTTLAAIRVNGVPEIAIEEALWLAGSVLGEGSE
jgi:DNA/RNA-binding domain of Phe-tRNA-synthetase-like protein